MELTPTLCKNILKKIILTGKGRSNNPGDVCVEFVDRSKEYFSVTTTSADRLKNIGWSASIELEEGLEKTIKSHM